MNSPPPAARRASYEQIRSFVERAGVAAGLEPDRARLLAEFLAGNDLRGNFSHGSVQIATYSRLMTRGSLNPKPLVKVVKETGSSLVVDGDGGLGYFPAYDGTRLLIDKVAEAEIAILLTRNHGHFGAAGLYAQLAVEAGLCAYVTSGHQLRLDSESSHYDAAGGSPMAFGAPAETPVVLDFGAMHDLYADNPERDDLARMAPGLILRSIGLGTICQIWGGFFSGLTSEPMDRPWCWEGANQGAMVICFRPDLFIDPAALNSAVDEYAKKVEATKPLPGLEAAYLPGGVEAAHADEWSSAGIPVSDEHNDRLDRCAAELGIKPIDW